MLLTTFGKSKLLKMFYGMDDFQLKYTFEFQNVLGGIYIYKVPHTACKKNV